MLKSFIRKNRLINICFHSIIVYILIISLSIVSYASVVSDNDGSAFITKAEFDSLKNNFQSQLDQYNSTIDSKIDNAIASYLAGVKVETKSNLKSILYSANSIKPVIFTKDWTVPTTTIGDKYELSSFFWWIFNITINNTTDRFLGTLGSMVYNGTGATLSSQNYGTVDTIICLPEKNELYNKYYIDNESFWNVKPRVFATCIVWHDSWSGFVVKKANMSLVTLAMTDLGTLQNRNSSFGIKNYTTTITGTNGEGGSNTYPNVNVNYITQTQDTSLAISSVNNNKYIHRLAGNKVEGVIKSTIRDNWNRTETTPLDTFDCNTNSGWWSLSYLNRNENNIYAPSLSNPPTGLPKVEVYLKYNTNLNADSLIHNAWSSAVNKEIKYYNGIPIFSAPSDGIIELPLKFTVDGTSGGANFSIRKEPFNNTAALESSTVKMYTNKELTTEYTNATFSGTSYEKTLYFKVKKGEIFWIKVNPTSDNDVEVNTNAPEIVLYSNNQ